MRARTTALTLTFLAMATLTACTPVTLDAAAPSASASSPAPAPSAAVPSATPAASVDEGACASAVSPEPVTDPEDPEQLGGETLAVPFDQGSLPLATGEAVTDADGIPVAYTVAQGDAFSVIATRFCVSEHWLQMVNHVRRVNNGLYAGDTLNLDPHTIFSVGDQNGVVSDNTFPDGYKIPPQR